MLTGTCFSVAIMQVFALTGAIKHLESVFLQSYRSLEQESAFFQIPTAQKASQSITVLRAIWNQQIYQMFLKDLSHLSELHRLSSFLCCLLCSYGHTKHCQRRAIPLQTKCTYKPLCHKRVEKEGFKFMPCLGYAPLLDSQT